MRKLSPARKLSALAGFLVLGVSPSFMDWEQEAGTGRRRQIVAYYAIALPLIYVGILKD